MPELPFVVKDFILHNVSLVTWLVFFFILFLGLFLQRAWIKEYIGEWKLNKLLKNIGVESLHNVSIADDMGENIIIEHLVLTANNIILLDVKKIRGLIFAAKKIEQWTQVVGNKSYKFKNPLHQLENDATLLNSKIENADIVSKVLFITGSEFPKGKPEDVVTLSEVKSWSLEPTTADVPQKLRDSWNQLRALVISSGTNEEILIEKNQLAGLNMVSLVMTIFLLFLWLVWRL